MQTTFYKQRKNRLVSGVIAGLSDKFGWDLTIARVLAAIFMYFSGLGILLYIILAICLPYKEDLYRHASQKRTYRPSGEKRQRKDAEVIDDDAKENVKWFW